MNAEVVEKNYVATNGIIHILNDVVHEIGNKTIIQRVMESTDLSMFYAGTGIVTGLRDKLNSKFLF